jgi:hypothetical protein
MIDVTVKSSDVDNLVRAIREHADAKALRRELARGLNSATKHVRGQMTEVIPAALPKRGGLAAQMQSQVRSSTTAKSGKWAGVSIRFRSSGYDVRTLTGRRLRHPVWGNRKVWVDQTAGVDPAIFTAEFTKQSPQVQRAIVEVLDGIARKVTNI